MSPLRDAKNWRRLTTPFRPRGGRWDHVYAALDLGTNNCRMLIARPTRSGFRVVDSFSRIVRLGEGLHATGRLGNDAVERTLEALKICASKMEKTHVTQVRGVATEACRRAKNADAFALRVREETGLELETISASEEVRLSAMGCETLLLKSSAEAIVLDIGGGSTEVALASVKDGALCGILDWVSLPCGVVTFTERFPSDAQEAKPAYDLMVEAVRAMAAPFEARHDLAARVARGSTQIVATSGTATTLAALHLGLARYNRKRVDGAWIDRGSLFTLSRRLCAMTLDQRRALSCIGEDRADLIVAGCAILDGVAGAWPFRHIQVADRGLREGILLELMDRADAATRNVAS